MKGIKLENACIDRHPRVKEEYDYDNTIKDLENLPDDLIISQSEGPLEATNIVTRSCNEYISLYPIGVSKAPSRINIPKEATDVRVVFGKQREIHDTSKPEYEEQVKVEFTFKGRKYTLHPAPYPYRTFRAACP